MGAWRRWLGRLGESDEARLAGEVRTWASSIAGTVRIADAAPRTPVRIAGEVTRIRILPVPQESLEALVDDGTGEVLVVFMGRRDIGGLSLGSRIVAEGTLGEQHGARRIVNPRFEFAAA